MPRSRPTARDLLQLAQGLAELDVFAALAEVALLRRYVRPAVDDGPAIEIDAGRHPVVELMLTDEPFVPNDTRLMPAAAHPDHHRAEHERQEHLRCARWR